MLSYMLVPCVTKSILVPAVQKNRTFFNSNFVVDRFGRGVPNVVDLFKLVTSCSLRVFLFLLPVLVFFVFNSCCSFSFVVYVPIKLKFSFSLFDISPTSDCRYYNYK